jgi:hypothetical protein
LPFERAISRTLHRAGGLKARFCRMIIINAELCGVPCVPFPVLSAWHRGIRAHGACFLPFFSFGSFFNRVAFPVQLACHAALAA